MGNLYGLLIGHKGQHALIDAHCYGDCSKVILGIIHDAEIGPMAVCRIPADQCPRFEKEIDREATVQGEPLFIRKLK
jgi:hypothetical protein